MMSVVLVVRDIHPRRISKLQRSNDRLVQVFRVLGLSPGPLEEMLVDLHECERHVNAARARFGYGMRPIYGSILRSSV